MPKFTNYASKLDRPMSKDGICLNIGCGLDAPEGWVNIDSSPSLKLSKIPIANTILLSILRSPDWPQSVKFGDLVKCLKIADSSCDLVFASHIIEHLYLSDFSAALENIHSYLKTGGVLRIIVPDLEKCIATYTTRKQDEAWSAKAAHEFMNESCLGRTETRNSLYKRLVEVFSNSKHQWMWDEPSLLDALAQQGFKNIRQRDYGEWSDQRFEAFEKQDRHWNAICMEATK
ncbi:MAG: hypothetical protein BRC36_18145 [Cyanobacteria bacterium QH_2_48_84]|nr:MAG: hypothetical protein BRC36_18145 [Cyanobacteria bacterium QH_2_48_84]